MKVWIIIIVVIVLTTGIFVYLSRPKLSISPPKSNMKLTSSVFLDNQQLPKKYSCAGEGVNPPLEITEVPEGTQSLILILKDPDAPLNTFIHWLVWNIRPATKSIAENSVPEGSTQGKNSAGTNVYFNPCPPSGQHHYIFYLYAVDTTLTLPQEATNKEVEQTIVGHTLGAATLTGLFP